MPNQLTVTKTLTGVGWTIVATLNSGATFPREIFAYENSGTDQLGDFYGVLSPSDLDRIQIWQGNVIPIFANKFVRSATANIKLAASEDPDVVISKLIISVKLFSTNFFATQETTTVYTI